MYKKRKEKEGRQNKTSDKIDFVFFFYNVNVFKMLFKSIHLETDLEEEHEQKHHN